MTQKAYKQVSDQLVQKAQIAREKRKIEYTRKPEPERPPYVPLVGALGFRRF